jgi:hypothetical protein
MDPETLDMFLELLTTSWPRPMDAYEISMWQRKLSSLEEQLVGEAPQWEFTRPDLAAFAMAYDLVAAAHQPPPPDPEDAPASKETVTLVHEAAKAELARAREEREQRIKARSALVHAGVPVPPAREQLL